MTESIKNLWEQIWHMQNKYSSFNNTSELPWEIYKHDKNLEEMISSTDISNFEILELGCGSGYDTKFLSKKGKNITAIDISSKAIEIAKSNNNSSNITYIVGDINKDIPNKKYDLVFDKGCIHNNMHTSVDIFKNIYDCLNDNGVIILISGNINQEETLLTRPPGLSISDIEYASKDFFKIRVVKEITYELNENYGNGLGWIFLLEKR